MSRKLTRKILELMLFDSEEIDDFLNSYYVDDLPSAQS